jgi:phosphonate transport system substrate-binding protein
MNSDDLIKSRAPSSPFFKAAKDFRLSTPIARAAAIALLFPLFSQLVCGGEKAITIALPPDGLSQTDRSPLQLYLAQRLGRDVRLFTPESYNATMQGLSDGSIDFACLGGLTYVRARAMLSVVPLVQRTIDLQFHTVFITGADSAIHSLRDLKGKKFAFGDINSTSGHLMAYREMKQAGIDPDHDLDFRYSGAHPLTVKLVEMGIVDAGAVDETVFNSLASSGKVDTRKVRVFFTSKQFVDWVYVASKDVSAAEREKFSAALLKLKKGKDDDVLRILRANKFIRANNEEYDSVRELARELKIF